MLKPSELTPLFAEALKQAVAETFAEDEVTVVTGGPEVGRAFAALPFDHLIFTGSTRTGRLVAEAAAKNLTPVTLELGGKSPVIVDASADLAKAADRIAFGKLFNAGQSCIAPDYALVPQAMVEPFAAALREAVARQYPTIATNPDYTSMVNDGHFARVTGLVDDAKARGARAIVIGTADGARWRTIAPTLLLDVTRLRWRSCRRKSSAPCCRFSPTKRSRTPSRGSMRGRDRSRCTGSAPTTPTATRCSKRRSQAASPSTRP